MRHRRRAVFINASRKAHIVTKPLISQRRRLAAWRSTRASELLTALKEGHLMASLQTEVDSGAPGSAIWKTRSIGVERIARVAISCSITINVVASMGIFNAALLPAELSFLQQAIALLMSGQS